MIQALDAMGPQATASDKPELNRPMFSIMNTQLPSEKVM